MELKNRHELVFIYDSKFANPNWDPTENNELRMIWSKLYVTDVRLKRTIRDYLDSNWKEVFVKECVDDDGKVLDWMWRLADKLWLKKSDMDKKPLTKEQLNKLLEYIDIRMFGSAIKVKMTWAVQFNFGESMHEIESIKIQWTTVFSSWEWKWQWTFTEMYLAPYSIISFHWVVNENAAKTTKMSEEDINSLKDAIWNGTKNLITRSKFEQLPRILIDVKFKDWVNTHIWELDKYIDFVPNEKIKDEKFIQDIQDWVFDFSAFVERINKYNDKIDSYDIWVDQRVKFTWIDSSKVKII